MGTFTFKQKTNKKMDNYFFEGTQKERQELKKFMNELTPMQLDQELKELGFKIEKSNSFYYSNTANKNKYNARSIYIIDIKSKLSFANVDFTRENPECLKKIQEFRFNNFAYCNKKQCIYEL